MVKEKSGRDRVDQDMGDLIFEKQDKEELIFVEIEEPNMGEICSESPNFKSQDSDSSQNSNPTQKISTQHPVISKGKTLEPILTHNPNSATKIPNQPLAIPIPSLPEKSEPRNSHQSQPCLDFLPIMQQHNGKGGLQPFEHTYSRKKASEK